MVTSPTTGLDITLDPSVQFFCSKAIANSSQKTYQSALKKFATFCSTYSVTTPFPVSEAILCYFSTYMACQGLSPQTIKVYLSGIRHMQMVIGLPDPKEFTSMPRLRMVQSGIQRHVSEQNSRETKIRLPITPAILQKMRDYWLPKSSDPDIKMLWAAAVICFFRIFPVWRNHSPKYHIISTKGSPGLG